MVSKSTASHLLNGRFTRFFIDTSGSNDPNDPPTWVVVGGELTGKYSIAPTDEDYTNKDTEGYEYIPVRYKWTGSFDTDYLTDDEGQQQVRDVALSVGQSTPLGGAPYGGRVRIGWRIQQDIEGNNPTDAGGREAAQSHMVGLASFKLDDDMPDSKPGKMSVTFQGSRAIDLSTDPGQ